MPLVEITNRTNKHFSMSYHVMAMGKDAGEKGVKKTATFHKDNINVPPGETLRYEMDDHDTLVGLMKDQHAYGVLPHDHENAGAITYKVFQDA